MLHGLASGFCFYFLFNLFTNIIKGVIIANVAEEAVYSIVEMSMHRNINRVTYGKLYQTML